MTASVLLLARAPRPGECKPHLQPLLGPAGCARLQAWLIERAVAWGRAMAPGRLHVAHSPADAGAELAELAGEGAGVFAQEGSTYEERLAAAVARTRRDDGPLLVIGTDLPGLSPAHGASALEDIAAGCDVSVGPANEGGFYLLALGRALPAALEVPALLSEAAAGSLRIGLLRSERGLHTPDDARAVCADPLTPPELRALLAAPGG